MHVSKFSMDLFYDISLVIMIPGVLYKLRLFQNVAGRDLFDVAQLSNTYAAGFPCQPQLGLKCKACVHPFYFCVCYSMMGKHEVYHHCMFMYTIS